MLHRNENFCLLLFTRKFSDLLGIAVAKGLVIKTIGDIGPGKFDNFSLPGSDRGWLVLGRTKPLLQLAPSASVKTNYVEQSVCNVRFPSQW